MDHSATLPTPTHFGRHHVDGFASASGRMANMDAIGHAIYHAIDHAIYHAIDHAIYHVIPGCARVAVPGCASSVDGANCRR